MWIRSQDKDVLCEVKNLMVERSDGKFGIVELIKTSYGCATKIVLGEYSTEEKAIKVLDMIQKEILKCNCVLSPINNGEVVRMLGYAEPPKVFEMPQDSEVEE